MNGVELADGKKFFNSMFEMRTYILEQLDKEMKEKERKFWEILNLEVKLLNKHEIWKDIKGYEGLYQISNIGRVRSLNYRRSSAKKVIKPWKAGDGYLQVHLFKNKKKEKKYIHRLVAEAFLDKADEGLEVNHKDENKINNCISNIEWCTHMYNCEYSLSKPIAQYDLKGNLIKKYKSIREAERDTTFAGSSISKCCKGKLKSVGGYVWKYI